MAGLDNIKKFQSGEAAGLENVGEQTGNIPTESATVAVGKNKYTPGQTEDILAKMQQYVDERESPFAKFAGGLSAGMATARGPAALAIYQKQKQEEDKQVMDYRQQMAQMASATEQAKFNQNIYASKLKRPETTTQTSGAISGVGTTASGGMTYDGIPVPESVQARLKGDSFYDSPIIEEWLKTRTTKGVEKELSPAMSQIVKIWIPGKGDQDVTVAMAEDFLKNDPNLQAIIGGKKVPAAKAISQAYIENPPSTTPITFSDPSIKIISAQRTPEKGQELWDQSVKNGTPGVLPNGNPVAKPGTSEHEKALGSAYDIDSKTLTRAGRAELAQKGYYQPLGVDSNHWEKIPTNTAPIVPTVNPITAPTTNAIVAPTAPTANPIIAPTAPTAPTAPANIKSSQVVSGPPEPPNPANYPSRSAFDTAKLQWEKDSENYNKTKQELDKSNIASIKEEADKFIARSNYDTLGERAGNNEYLKTLVKKWGGNPNVAGTLNDPTWGNAIATALQKGVNTPGGNIAMPDIVEILQKTRPGATTDEIEASKELARVLGQRILEVVQKSKGSSSDKDWLAFKQIAGSADNGWDALQRIQKYDEAQIRKDKAERGLFDETYNGQTFDYNKHIINPKRIELYDNYGKELSDINRTHYKFEVTPPRPGGVPQGAMYNPKLKKWGWYDQNKKWVTN